MEAPADSPMIRVQDAVSEASIGAAILRVLPPDSRHAVSAAEASTVIANPRGEISLPAEQWRGDGVWVVSANGYRPVETRPMSLVSEQVDGVVTLRLKRGSSVSGTVVTPWGAPVADAQVTAYGRYGVDFDGTEEFYTAAPGTSGEVLRAQTDAEGRFELRGIGAFPVRIQASKSGFARKADSEEDDLFVYEAGDQVRLVLRPRLVGGLRMIDSVTGRLIHDFAVKIRRSEGPSTGLLEASARVPGTVEELGFSYKDGEYWVVGCHSDESQGASDTGRIFLRWVRAPGYETVEGVRFELRPLGSADSLSPTLVKMNPTAPQGRGLLRVHVASRLKGLELPWAKVRVEGLPSAPEEGSEPLAWTYHVRLDEAGRAERAVRLPPGRYRIRLARGTGWAMWRPSSEASWKTVAITDSSVEEEVVLHYRAALLRVSASRGPSEPVGMFNLSVHDISPTPPGERGVVNPQIAFLSEHHARWWQQYGNPYRTHLRMQPGAFDLLVAPGRYFVKVTKTGFSGPEPQDVIVEEGRVLPVSFELDERSQPEKR